MISQLKNLQHIQVNQMKTSDLSQQSLRKFESNQPLFQIKLIHSSKMYPFPIKEISNFIQLNNTCLIQSDAARKYLTTESPLVYRKLCLSKYKYALNLQETASLFIQNAENTNNKASNINQFPSKQSSQNNAKSSVIVQILLVDNLSFQIQQNPSHIYVNDQRQILQKTHKELFPVLYAPYSVYKNLLDIYHKQCFLNPKQQLTSYQISLFAKIQRFPISYTKNFQVESVDQVADKIIISGIQFPKSQLQTNQLKDLITKLIIHPKFNHKKNQSTSTAQTQLSEFLIFPQTNNNRVSIDISWLDQCHFLKYLNKLSLQLKTKLLHLKKQNDHNQNLSRNTQTHFIEFKINYKSIKQEKLSPNNQSKILIVKFVPGKTKIEFESNPSLRDQLLQPFITNIRLSPIYQYVYQNNEFYHHLGQKLSAELSSQGDHFICLKTDKSIGIGSFLQNYVLNILNKRFIRINCQHFVTQSEFYSKLKQINLNGNCFLFIKNILWLQNLSKNQDILQETSKSLIEKIHNLITQAYMNSFNQFTCLLYFSEGNLPEELPQKAKRWQLKLQKPSKLRILDSIFVQLEKQTKIDFEVKEIIRNSIGNSVGWTKINKFILQSFKKQSNDLNEKNVSKAIQKHFNLENVENVAEVSWSDIGGLETAKQEIIQTVLLPTKHPEIFDEWIRPRTGLLFYGPPGTGKTLLGKCIAKQCKMGFISVKGPQLLNMYVGESEKNVRQIFQRAKQSKPCIVFMDQLDALVPKRGNSSDGNAVMDRIVAELLMQIDLASENQVFVIGATNRPDLLDPSILRAGRFDKQIYLGISKNKEERIKILKAQTRNSKLQENFNYELIVDKVPTNFTGADFYGLTSKAMMKAVEKSIQKVESGQQSDPEVLISQNDFMDVLDSVKPSVTDEQLKHYESLKQRFS